MTPALSLLCGLLLAACAAVESPGPLEPDHPASPQAAEAPLPEPSTLAEPLPGGLPAAASPEATPRMGGRGAYTCPMHPDVQQTAPGRCPRCGMALVREAGRQVPPEAHHAH